jgi:STE24 endopeptidase
MNQRNPLRKGRSVVDAGLLAGCGAAAVVAALVLFAVGAARARAIERSAGPDRAHELRVLLVRLGTASAVCGGVVCGSWVVEASRSVNGAAAIAVFVVVGVVCVALPIVAARVPVLAAYARVRGIRARALWPSPRLLAGTLIMFAALVGPFLAVLVAGFSFPVAAAVLLAVYLVVEPVLLGLLVPVLAWCRGARPLPADVQQRLSGLAAWAGVAVRGRMIAGRERKLANAWQFGWLPGLRYVLLTDYLLDEFPPAEIDAVLAHEIGHARHNDIRTRQFFACLVMAAACVVIEGAVTAGSWSFAVDAAAIVAVWVVMALRRATFIRRELAADDLAVAAVGREPVAAALQRLTDLNAIKRDTSKRWNRRTGHPAMAERLARLQAGDLPAPAGTAPAGTAPSGTASAGTASTGTAPRT